MVCNEIRIMRFRILLRGMTLPIEIIPGVVFCFELTNDEFKDMKASLRASYQHNTENGRLYLSGTSQRDSYYSLNASWNGSFTATRHGAAFHDYSGSADSRFMIDADGTEDIPLNNKRAVTNRYGIGVIPSVSSYITTSLSVDTRNLPEKRGYRKLSYHHHLSGFVE